MSEEWTDDLPWLGQYVLDENGEAVPASGLLEWGQWMEEHSKDRILAKDKVGNMEVSTVFLGLDQGRIFLLGREGIDPTTYKPTLWETMIFGGAYDLHQLRYTSRAEALEGHKKIVQMLTS
jgi:hypothetical protein